MNPTGANIASVKDVRDHLAQTVGAQSWDGPGIRAALEATPGAPGDVLAAAHLAAGDATLRLPSERAFLAHWPQNASAAHTGPRWTPCPERGHQDQDATSCALCRSQRAQAAQIAPEGSARVREALAEARAARQPSPAERRQEAGS